MYDLRTLFAVASPQVRLRDGSYCRIRPTSVADRHLVADCFARLSPDSRRMRFFIVKPRLSETDLDLFSSADGHDHIALVAVRVNELGQEQSALGFVRCTRPAQAPETAELSIAVADDVQRLGVGSALLDRLSRAARSEGVLRFDCEVLVENRGMRALAKRMGAVSHWQGDGTVEYSWPLTDDLAMEGLPWMSDPRKELSQTFGFWWTLMGQAASVGLDYGDAMARGFGPGDRSVIHDIWPIIGSDCPQP